MRAILEFQLPDDNSEFRSAIQAVNLESACWQYTQYLRNKLKYEQLTDEQYKAYEDARSKFWEFMAEYNIKID
jgi:hypothetical protein